MNFCTVCTEDFGSVSAFDAHRIGRHEYEFSGDYPDGRRCLTVDELIARRWRRDGRGRWRRHGDGAPWASSDDQVTAEAAADTASDVPRRSRRRNGCARLPERGRTRADRRGTRS